MARHRPGEPPQRRRQNIREHEIERRVGADARRNEARRVDGFDEAADPVEPRVLCRDDRRARVDVGGEHARTQELGRRDREHARARAEIENAPGATAAEQRVEQDQASARGAVMTGAEGERRLDFDADRVRRDPAAIMAPMHDEASGANGREPFEARSDPVPGRDRGEGERARRLVAGRVPHRLAHAFLVRRKSEMKRKVPAAGRGLERGDHDLVGVEVFGQEIGDPPRGGFPAQEDGCARC